MKLLHWANPRHDRAHKGSPFKPKIAPKGCRSTIRTWSSFKTKSKNQRDWESIACQVHRNYPLKDHQEI
jgi:hypothetical protein